MSLPRRDDRLRVGRVCHVGHSRGDQRLGGLACELGHPATDEREPSIGGGGPDMDRHRLDQLTVALPGRLRLAARALLGGQQPLPFFVSLVLARDVAEDEITPSIRPSMRTGADV